MKQTIEDFIIGQITNAQSPQAAALAYALQDAIREYKEDGGENDNALSVDATYIDGTFQARCVFYENMTMIVMYYENTDNETVASLYELRNEKELCRLAGLMLSEGWVDGFAP